jgi:hypothetical protein
VAAPEPQCSASPPIKLCFIALPRIGREKAEIDGQGNKRIEEVGGDDPEGEREERERGGPWMRAAARRCQDWRSGQQCVPAAGVLTGHHSRSPRVTGQGVEDKDKFFFKGTPGQSRNPTHKFVS